MEYDAELRGSIQKEAARTELELSDASERTAPGMRSQIAQMRRQMEQIDRRQAERERTLSQRMAHRDRLEAERKSRQADLAAAETRLREARGDAGYRGERLRIIDPGIVPQRPSSPNLMLNLLAALLAGLVLSTGYLAVEMNYREQTIAGRRDYPAEVRR
jgi:capsule polysaccharide export protein KpsE/RkpR